MKYGSISDIFAAHTGVRERFVNTVNGIPANEAEAHPDGEAWSIEQIVEHVAIVENSMLRICTKLIGAAREVGKASDGSFALTDDFAEKSSAIRKIKVAAPERVHPTGEVSVAESLQRMAETTAAINALRTELEAWDGSSQKFPHPHFGDLTAAEWLVIRTGHEQRHIDQIENILAKIRQ
jgi:hypothetical protein